jgi:aminoglycoside 3-N-acetyltransferase
MNLESRKRDKVHVTKNDINKGLTSVGLNQGDVVLVHSSLSSFGYVEGGADAVIDALLETVGPVGTVVVPTFTGNPTDMEIGVEAVFDVANRTVDKTIGIIPEFFRQRREAVRSLHICHSVAAIGPQAEYLMGEGISAYGVDSSFARLHELDSWNLFLGCSFNSCTALHMPEEQLEVPFREYRDFKSCKVILPDGTEVPCRSVEFQRGQIVRDGYDLGKMDEVLAQEGILRTSNVGEATIINAKLRDIYDRTLKHLQQDVGFLLTAEARRQVREELGV